MAALGLALTPTFADPSLAWKAELTPAASPIAAHAAPGFELTALALNTVRVTPDLLDKPGFATPLADHAAATVTLEDLPAANAPVPAVDAEPVARPLAELVDEHASTDVADSEHDCLAGAVYFESKGEPLIGQLAVAEVILNRANSGRFPSSICGVVKQRGQFSFVRGGRIPAIPRASAAWKKAVAIAYIARESLAEGTAPDALFFHARYVSPGWRNLKRVASVGNHIFYR